MVQEIVTHAASHDKLPYKLIINWHMNPVSYLGWPRQVEYYVWFRASTKFFFKSRIENIT